MVTSDITKREISKIPVQHRQLHEAIFSLLDDLPVAATHQVNSGLTLMGVGGGVREDPVFYQLRTSLPDFSDAEHVFQAAKNNVGYFLTVDQHTILKHAHSIKAACGLTVVTPLQLAAICEIGLSSAHDR